MQTDHPLPNSSNSIPTPKYPLSVRYTSQTRFLRKRSLKTLFSHPHIHFTLPVDHHLIVLQHLGAHSVSRRFSASHELELCGALFGDELEAVNGNPRLAGGLTEVANLLEEGRIEFIS